MQPSEPATGPPAQPSPPVPVGGARRNRRARLWLALAAGIAMLLCLGGVGVFISIYDEATEIKRSAPDAVVDSFLGAYLVDRDDAAADLYVCESGADLGSLAAYRAKMVDIEKTQNVGIRVSWSSLAVTGTGTTRTVNTDLTQTATDGARLKQPWSFGLVEQDGWRVCSAAPVA